MKKVIITILAVAIVVGILSWWFIFHRLDALVAKEITNAGTEVIGTKVTLDGVRLDLLNGSVTLENLSIANPEGFSRENAFVIGKIEAALDFEARQIARVVLDESRVYIEEKSGLINIQELKKSLESRISDSTIVPNIGRASQEELVIQLFLMRSTMATFESDSLQRLSEVEIDQIEMRDLRGSPEELAEQIALEIVDEITAEAQQAMVRGQLENLQDRALDELRGLLGAEEDEGG